ncbi:MAG TPA: dihydrolipoyl dehydrogenase [Candidatus Saccharimonadales bacterium]
MPKQKFDYDLIVIGAGAGGSVAATIANNAGKRVAMIEAGRMGGECPNWGCIPTKAMIYAANIYADAKHASEFGLRTAMIGYNYPSIKAWKDKVVRRTGAAQGKQYYESLGIDVIKGEAHFLSPYEVTVNRRHYTAANFIIASGSKTTIPPIDGLADVPYITNREALELNRPPKSTFIVGGGAIGCEFAQLFATFGSKVHIAEIAPRILPNEDEETSKLLTEIFTKQNGMSIHTNAKVLSVEKEGVAKRVTYRIGDDTRSVRVDELMIATGKEAIVDFGLENAGISYSRQGITVNEHLQTNVSHIYAAGDVIGHFMFTHMSIYQGRLAAHNVLHPRKMLSADYRAVPHVIFLQPEVAAVGMLEDECLKRAMEYKKATAPISIISRANVNDINNGFVKVITNQHGILIGATVVAPHAGEIIHELTLAVQLGVSASEVASTIHAFPTWSEAVRVACAKIK